MVHSIELVFDPDTEFAIRAVWQQLSDAGLRAPAQTTRPHLTMVVAEVISPDVDEALGPAGARLPVEVTVGAPMVFGKSPFILVRSVVPSTKLLELHAETASVSRPFVTSPLDARQWSPHVTLARRVEPAQLARALTIRKVTREVSGVVVGLRRWDGNRRVEHAI